MALRPVQDWPAHYEPGAVRQHCPDLDDYVVLTSPSAWKAVQPEMPRPPRALAHVISQEEQFNESLITRLPTSDWVVGVGGGMALDAAKYVAWKMEARLILVPTIVSTGAIFQPHFPSRRDGRCTILNDLAAPEKVLFDTDIIRAAPPRLNASGMAECISWLGTVASWRWWCEQDLPGVPWDQAAADEVNEWVESRFQQYSGDLDGEGRPGPTAIRACAEVNRERYQLKMFGLKAGHALDHLLDNTFVRVHKRNLLHGELVALGTLISGLTYGSEFDRCRAMFDACGTNYLPSQIGCTWSQVRSTIATIRENADDLGWFDTYFHHRSFDETLFQMFVDRIEPLP